MKYLFVILLLSFFSLISFSQEAEELPIYESFHWDFKPAVGAGVSVVSNASYGYANLKVFTFRYGEEDVGMKFLGLGLTSDFKDINWGLSICAMNMNKILLSIDTNVRSTDSSLGVSLNYSF